MRYLEGLSVLLHVEDLEECLDPLKFMPTTLYDTLETCLGGYIRFVTTFSSPLSPAFNPHATDVRMVVCLLHSTIHLAH